ncbi:MAG: hypothetical protein AAGE52_23510 [Myxococcota bacterium]
MARRFLLIACFFLVACGDDSSSGDAGFDAAIDAARPDTSVDAGDEDAGVDAGADGEDVGVDAADSAVEMDAGSDGGLADPGFGDILGPCAMIIGELSADAPSFFVNRLDFGSDPFDDPEDVDALTAGGQQILEEGTAGGSSIVSELFAYEVLERCEGASFLKSETNIIYVDVAGAITDLLVAFGDQKIGVSVTRAVGFPRDDPYPVSEADRILTDKLMDVLESSARVAPDDAWDKQILVVMAYGEMHAESLRTAWDALDASVTADTIVYVVITDGMDAPLY